VTAVTVGGGGEVTVMMRQCVYVYLTNHHDGRVSRPWDAPCWYKKGSRECSPGASRPCPCRSCRQPSLFDQRVAPALVELLEWKLNRPSHVLSLTSIAVVRLEAEEGGDGGGR
jgi:hypothetical protein